MRACLVLLASLALSSAAPASAAPDTQAAKKLFETGSQFYARGQYLPAIRAFEAARQIMSTPAMDFSLAQALRLQYFVDRDPARLRQAVELYRGYVDATLSGERRPDAVTTLAELVPLLSAIDSKELRVEPAVRAPPPTEVLVTSNVDGAKVSIDDGPEVDLPVALTTSPGSHRLKVTHPEYFPADERVDAIDGRSVGVQISLVPMPARVSVVGDEGVVVERDGKVIAETPLSTPLELEAGHHVLLFRSSGRVPLERTLELTRGQAEELQVELPLTTQRKWAYGLMLGSIAAFASAGITFALAAGDDSDAQTILAGLDSPGISLAAATEYHELRDARDAKLTLGTAVLGVGVAVVSTGLALMLAD